MIMAIRTTLFEELTFDQGPVVGPNLSDYNIPSALDCAAVSQTILEIEGAESTGWARRHCHRSHRRSGERARHPNLPTPPNCR